MIPKSVPKTDPQTAPQIAPRGVLQYFILGSPPFPPPLKRGDQGTPQCPLRGVVWALFWKHFWGSYKDDLTGAGFVRPLIRDSQSSLYDTQKCPQNRPPNSPPDRAPGCPLGMVLWGRMQYFILGSPPLPPPLKTGDQGTPQCPLWGVVWALFWRHFWGSYKDDLTGAGFVRRLIRDSQSSLYDTQKCPQNRPPNTPPDRAPWCPLGMVLWGRMQYFILGSPPLPPPLKRGDQGTPQCPLRGVVWGLFWRHFWGS
jgi:hypothetical protein